MDENPTGRTDYYDSTSLQLTTNLQDQLEHISTYCFAHLVQQYTTL